MRRLARRLGVDVSRYPAEDSHYRALRAILSTQPDVILDVGANDGGFARMARAFGYEGDIVSFEPGEQAQRRLAGSAAGDSRWFVECIAIGSQNTDQALNIAANEGASSSFLPMLPAHTSAAPNSAYVGREVVPVRRLDDWHAQHGRQWDRLALKVDTQGFERQVLDGAQGILANIVAIQIELSLAPLYAGAWDWDQALGWLSSNGFTMAAVVPGFYDEEAGRMLQFDGVFIAEC